MKINAPRRSLLGISNLILKNVIFILLLLPFIAPINSYGETELRFSDYLNSPGTHNNEITVYFNHQDDIVTGIAFDVCEENDSLECTSCAISSSGTSFNCELNELSNGCCSILVTDYTGEQEWRASGHNLIDIRYKVQDGAQLGSEVTIDAENIMIYGSDRRTSVAGETTVETGIFRVDYREENSPRVTNLYRGEELFARDRHYYSPAKPEDQISIIIKDESEINMDKSWFGFARADGGTTKVDVEYEEINAIIGHAYKITYDPKFIDSLETGTYKLYAHMRDYCDNKLYTEIYGSMFFVHKDSRHSISGRIVDEVGNTVNKPAHIWAIGPDTAYVYSGNGAYIFTDLQPGRYTFGCAIPWTDLALISPLVVTLGSVDLANKNLVVKPQTSELSGRIRYANGLACVGATVRVTGAKSVTTTTGPLGGYTFDLPNGNYTIRASKDGFNMTPTSISVTISGNDISGKDFTATEVRNYTLWGRVFKSTGGILRGATIRLTGAKSATTTTGPYGYYKFENLAPGSYSVRASKTDYTFNGPFPVTISSRDVGNKNFTATLNKTYSISGKTLKANGTGLSYTYIRITGPKNVTVRSNFFGNFTVSNLPPGNYKLEPWKSGYKFWPTKKDVRITSSNRSGVVFYGY